MLTVQGRLSHFHSNEVDGKADYPQSLDDLFNLERCGDAQQVITQWPGYQATPLYRLEALAAAVGISRLYYKDESKRFHLKSFKALGGAYAVARQLQLHLEAKLGIPVSIEELLQGVYRDMLEKVVISCATDGNHGRSVAWGCQMFGCACVIYIHSEVSAAREQAMKEFGARVIRISGNYDDSVKQADADARQHGRIIVSDTSYPGYMEIPKDVALGYTVMLAELVEQLDGDIPSHVFIQGGVGGLASAVCAYFWLIWGAERPRFIIVEPEAANCLQQSARAGEPVVVEGDLETLMAGLSCGEVSELAWRVLSIGCDDFMTINETAVPQTMRLLAQGYDGDPAIEAGESAVAGLAALITAQEDQAMSDKLGLDADSRVLVIGTEGATDPELYRALVDG